MFVSAVSVPAAYAAPLPPPLPPSGTRPVAASLQPQFSRLLDARLGISILQFRDRDGNVARTLPSQRQLAAYAEPGAILTSANGAFV